MIRFLLVIEYIFKKKLASNFTKTSGAGKRSSFFAFYVFNPQVIT